MGHEITIYDTTLRDGAQSVGVTYSVEDKLKILQILDDFGIPYIEGGWVHSNPKDREFFTRVKKVPSMNAKLCVFSNTQKDIEHLDTNKDVQRLIKTEVPVVTIVGKTWDFQVTQTLGVSLEQNIAMVHETSRFLKKYFDEVIFDAEHFFDGYKENSDYAKKIVRAAEDAGCDWVVLCDTNGGTLLNECSSIVSQIKSKFQVPFGIHTHNDTELAVANSMIAVDKGVTMVQGTINGLGERCGNANLCSIVANLSLKQTYKTIPSSSLKKLSHVSHVVSEIANQTLSPFLPYTGSHAFSHKGGIHVSAVCKQEKSYEHISPELVGNKRFFPISELSGKTTIMEKARELGIDVGEKDISSIKTMVEKIKELESRGYHFEGAEASFELLYKSHLGKFNPYFILNGFRVIIWKNSDDNVWSEVTIKAEIPEEISKRMDFKETIEHTSADGRGPVEALDRALRKVLEKFYPQLQSVKLIDYKVRILNEDAGTKATTRVLITSKDEKRKWSTVGVSDNIIDASWQALVDSLNFKLMKDDEDRDREIEQCD